MMTWLWRPPLHKRGNTETQARAPSRCPTRGQLHAVHFRKQRRKQPGTRVGGAAAAGRPSAPAALGSFRCARTAQGGGMRPGQGVWRWGVWAWIAGAAERAGEGGGALLETPLGAARSLHEAHEARERPTHVPWSLTSSARGLGGVWVGSGGVCSTHLCACSCSAFLSAVEELLASFLPAVPGCFRCDSTRSTRSSHSWRARGTPHCARSCTASFTLTCHRFHLVEEHLRQASPGRLSGWVGLWRYGALPALSFYFSLSHFDDTVLTGVAIRGQNGLLIPPRIAVSPLMKALTHVPRSRPRRGRRWRGRRPAPACGVHSSSRAGG
jgi:hypothetical protein